MKIKKDGINYGGKHSAAQFSLDDTSMTPEIIENRKKYEIEFAQHLLKCIKKVKGKDDFRSVQVYLSDEMGSFEIQDFVKVFYKDLESNDLIKDLEFFYVFERLDKMSLRRWYAKFNTFPKELVEYLNDYIKTDGLLKERIIIYAEPDYGFYIKGDRDNRYGLLHRGEGKKTFKMIMLLADKGELSASKLATSIDTISNKISDIRKRINEQFQKQCGILSEVVVLSANGNYRISDKFLIKQTRNL
jgi:hypothetical protein